MQTEGTDEISLYLKKMIQVQNAATKNIIASSLAVRPREARPLLWQLAFPLWNMPQQESIQTS